MSRVYVVVEGQTEESFIGKILAPVLWPHNVYLKPLLLGRRGGRPSYARVRKDVLAVLKQDHSAYCTTMLDFYGLGEGFPGTPQPQNSSATNRVVNIEHAMKRDVIAEIPGLRPDVRFFPYIQLHEYEGLLFSDPAAFAHGIGQQHLAQRFTTIRNSVATPEDIDDDPNSAPSKRVIAAYSGYQKVVDGTLAAQAVGIDKMRQECPHFRQWLESLESLAE